MRRAILATVGLVVAAMLPAACKLDDCCPPHLTFDALPPCLADAHGPLSLAVGARANQPAPLLPAPVATLVAKAAYNGSRISVIGVDGDPKPQGDGTFATNVQNSIAWNDALKTFEGQIAQAIANVRPKTPEANPLEAVSRASDDVNTDGTVVLLDNGLQTVNPLNFTNAGLIDANPTEVVDYLEKVKVLPHLGGKTFVLAGIGKTEKPQESLDTARRDNLLAIWQEIGKRAGARCVGVVTETPRADALTDVKPVTPVVIPPLQAVPVPKGCQDTVLRDAGQVRFKPDTATFIDEAAARQALQNLATYINDHHLAVNLVGTTSSYGTEDGRRRLSQQRAEAVKTLLVQLGVTSTITTEGVGFHYPGYVPDKTADGVLIPDKAALNRNVIVQLTGCE